MQIVPVIDLMGGSVVHAQKGLRDCYRPIRTPLCKGSSPWEVIDALLGLHPFGTFYVADLDALMGRGRQRDLLDVLQRDYPNLQFWLDQGITADGVPGVGANGVPVIGTESLGEGSLAVLSSVRGEYILSLDFMEDRLLGVGDLFEESFAWPAKIIVMSLSRVGSGKGPDFQRLAKYRALWPEKQVFAAGGVRNPDDLKTLEGMGIDGALLASALHSGAMDASVLQKYG